MAGKFITFIGNRPGNVAKEAKYSIRYEKGEYVVGVQYQLTDEETWYPTSNEHPELVEKVNEIKLHFNGAPGGPFYINEYKQVLVPVGFEADYYYAGEYHEPLIFQFEGHTISGEAVDANGMPLKPGDKWRGPRPGIRYTLAGNGQDIYYRYSPRCGVVKTVKLSRHIGIQAARQVAGEIRKIKGHQGGRFYVNEFCSAFTPKQGDYGLDCIFVQTIELANWFPKPELGAEETAATD